MDQCCVSLRPYFYSHNYIQQSPLLYMLYVYFVTGSHDYIDCISIDRISLDRIRIARISIVKD